MQHGLPAGEATSLAWLPSPSVKSVAQMASLPPSGTLTAPSDVVPAPSLQPLAPEVSLLPEGTPFVPVSEGELRDEGGWEELREVLQDAERSGTTQLPLPPPPSTARFAPLVESQPVQLGRSTSLRTPSSQLAVPDASVRRLSNPLPPSAAAAFDPWAPRTVAENLPLRTSSLAANSTLAPPFVPAAAPHYQSTLGKKAFDQSAFNSLDSSPPFDPLPTTHGAPFTPPQHNFSAPSTPLFPDRQSFLPPFYDGASHDHSSNSASSSNRMTLGYLSADGSTSREVYAENDMSRGQAPPGDRRRRRSEGAHGMPRFGGLQQQSQPHPPHQAAPLSFSASRGHRGPPPSLYPLQPGSHRSLPPPGRPLNPPFTPPATAAAPTFSLTSQASAPQLRSGLTERTSHAMWVGNVPPDATEAELWAFFLSRPVLPNSNGTAGVQSVHLIARSQCAFVNLSSESHLMHTVAQSHGVLLRPDDPKCKPLVCRVRRLEDDAKSGVGAQRGGGLHKAWVEQKEAQEKRNSMDIGHMLEADRREAGSADSTSTNSDFFEEHFPKRFFILKSHNQFDLHQSAKAGWWSTQPHNEAVLDQAYRTASEGVYLIFSANKSGSWAGYARMAGPIFPPTSTPGPGSTVSAPRPPVVDFPPKMTSPAPRRPFRVQWLSTTDVPFSRTRHITNSFNAKREVKICRDGTEVEPTSGETLIEELSRAARSAPQPGVHPSHPLPHPNRLYDFHRQ